MAPENPTLVPDLPVDDIEPCAPHRKARSLCSCGEFLLFVDQYDCQFVQEAELRPSNINEAVSDCQDSTIQIIRMDQSSWRGEDVTEDVADAWLDLHEPEPKDESTLPEFVAESDAWQDYLDDFDHNFCITEVDSIR